MCDRIDVGRVGARRLSQAGGERRTECRRDQQTEFTKLFNGKDLTGWQAEGNARWVVENGLLVGTQGDNNAPGDLFTTESFRDFEASVTYRTEWPCNSGVWFRYQTPDKAYQADILEYKNPEAYSGTLYCPGKLFLAINKDKTLVNREGWNTIKIRAQGDHLQIWLNDRQVADVHDTDDRFRQDRFPGPSRRRVRPDEDRRPRGPAQEAVMQIRNRPRSMHTVMAPAS